MSEDRTLTNVDWKGLQGWIAEMVAKYQGTTDADAKKALEAEWTKIVANKFNAKKPKALLLNNAKNFADNAIKSKNRGVYYVVVTGISDPRDFNDAKIVAIRDEWNKKPETRAALIAAGKIACAQVAVDGGSGNGAKMRPVPIMEPATFDPKNKVWVKYTEWKDGNDVIVMESDEKLGDNKTDNFRKGMPMLASYSATAHIYWKTREKNAAYAKGIIKLSGPNGIPGQKFFANRVQLLRPYIMRLSEGKKDEENLTTFTNGKLIDILSEDNPDFDPEIFVCGKDGISGLMPLTTPLADAEQWHDANMIRQDKPDKLDYSQIAYDVVFITGVDLEGPTKGNSIMVTMSDSSIKDFKNAYCPRWMTQLPFKFELDAVKCFVSYQTRRSDSVFDKVSHKRVKSDKGDINFNVLGLAALSQATETPSPEQKSEIKKVGGEDEL